MKSRLELIN